VDASKMHLSVQARIAARNGDQESLELVAKHLKYSLSDLDEKGQTLLFYAVRGTRDDSGNLEPPGGTMAPKTQHFDQNCSTGDAARFLCEKHHLNLNHQVHDTGMTALMEAVRYGNIGTTFALLHLGADTSLHNAAGHTALDIAKTKVPAYLTSSECCVSQDRFEGYGNTVNNDRMQIAQLLQEVERHAGFDQFFENVVKPTQAKLEKMAHQNAPPLAAMSA
jgi:ankyrin repeat protein